MRLQPYEILVIRDSENFVSKKNFRYPELGYVEAPDFEKTYACGRGLHGNPWGEGDVYFIAEGNINQIFQVIKVDTRENFLYGRDPFLDKCKFKGGEVILSTKNIQEANNLIKKYNPKARCNHNIEYRNSSNEYYAGLQSTQRSKVNNALQIAKSFACQYSEGNATQIAEYYSIQKATYNAFQISGEQSYQHCGDNGIQVAGCNSMQHCYANSYQKAGFATVQICGSNARTLDLSNCNKWFQAVHHGWKEETDSLVILALEKRVANAKAKAEERSWNDEWLDKR